MAWCFSTRASVATVLTTHPCVSRCLRVKIISHGMSSCHTISPLNVWSGELNVFMTAPVWAVWSIRPYWRFCGKYFIHLSWWNGIARCNKIQTCKCEIARLTWLDIRKASSQQPCEITQTLGFILLSAEFDIFLIPQRKWYILGKPFYHSDSFMS